MDISILISLVGLVITVASLAYAIYVTRESRREKELVFEVLPPSPLAQVLARKTGYSIKILYEQPGQPPEQLDSVFIQYLRFANVGRVPIRQEDIVEPVLVQIMGCRVLDIAIAAIKREVCQTAIEPLIAHPDVATARLQFKFLDHGDGGLIQIVTDKATVDITMLGAVLEMPGGIREVQTNRSLSNPISSLVAVSVQFATLLAVFVVYVKFLRNFQGIGFNGPSNEVWRNIEIVFLGTLSAMVPPLILVLVQRFRMVAERRLTSALLKPPEWYSKRAIDD